MTCFERLWVGNNMNTKKYMPTTQFDRIFVWIAHGSQQCEGQERKLAMK
jgi:hypothetical protein